MKNKSPEKRDVARSKLYYPLELTLCSPRFLDKSFNGYINNLSERGVCVQLEDRYKRFEMVEPEGSRIDLEIELLEGDRVSCNAGICWVNDDTQSPSVSLFVGLEFKGLSDGQLEQIRRLSRLKKSDTRMLHALFDQHMHRISHQQ